jgi:hypothetical protein
MKYEIMMSKTLKTGHFLGHKASKKFDKAEIMQTIPVQNAINYINY